MEANREELISTFVIVRPALSAQSYVPALTHFRFEDEFVTAYNDVAAISVRSPIDYTGCVPGELLVKTLGKLPGQSVVFSEQEDGSIQLLSGRSKIKLPTLPVKDFPFSPPTDEALGEFQVTGDMLRGIEMCLVGVGSDPTHPAQMGITLEPGSPGTLFSTDNFTISRYTLKAAVKLPGDSPVILPAFFCTQLRAMSLAFPGEEITVHLHRGALFARFGSIAELFTKMLVDVEPMDFSRVVGRYLSGSEIDPIPVPDSLDSALERALLILGTEMDKTTSVSVEAGKMKLVTQSTMGESRDRISYEGEDFSGTFIDPVLVLRALKQAYSMYLTDKVTVLYSKDSRFLHLIAHCSR